MQKVASICMLLLLVSFSLAFGQKIHAHNDYETEKPFWGAFEVGAHSIEVDVYLKNNTLYVTHAEKEIMPSNTLDELYLKPLESVLGQMQDTLQLLVDIKSEAYTTLDALMLLLDAHPSLQQSKIKFVISGNRPDKKDYGNYPAYLFFDYQNIDKLPADLSKIALLSLPFYRFSNWQKEGTIAEEKDLLAIIQKAHAAGLPIRFWATPDYPLAWLKLRNMGVDFINTDHPKQCALFMK